MASMVRAQWWSYADGNETVLGIVVAAVAVAALLYVGSRIHTGLERRRRRRQS